MLNTPPCSAYIQHIPTRGGAEPRRLQDDPQRCGDHAASFQASLNPTLTPQIYLFSDLYKEILLGNPQKG